MIYCQSCSKDGKSVPAESYCTVCEELMCSNCTRLHRNQQMSSPHALLVEESTPISIKAHSMKNDGTEPCEIHLQEVIKYFCLTHKTLNCGHCLAVEHRSCDVEIISEVSNTFKDSSEYGHIKSSIVELLKNSDSCSSNIAQSIEFVTKLCEDELTKLRTFRNEVHKYFERSENDLLETIQNMKNMNEALLHCLQPKCESLKIEVQEIKAKLEAHENNTIKLFIEAKRAQKILDGLQAALADIMKKNIVQQYEFIKDPATERQLTPHVGLGVIQKNTARDIHTCVKPEDVRSDTGSSFNFGAGRSQSTLCFEFGTGSSTTSKPTGTGFQFGDGTAGTAKPASGFTFGAPTTTAASSVASLSSGGDSSTVSKPSGSGFQFGGASTDSAKSASGFTFGTPTTVPTGSGFVSGSSTATTKAATTTTTTTSKTGFTFGSSGSSSGFEFGSTVVSVSTSSASSSTSELKAVVSTVESTKDSSGTSIFGTKTSTTTAGIFGGAASSSIFGAKTTSEVRGVFGSSSVFTQSTGDGKQGLVFGGGASKAVETLKSTTEGGSKSAEFNTKTEMKDKVNNGESLLAEFLSSPDSWKCETCLISNDGKASKCVACGTEKSESTGSVLQEMGTTGAGKSAFSVGSVFGQAETQPSAFNFGQAASTDKKSDEGFKFTIAPGSDTHSSQPAASLGSGFNFSKRNKESDDCHIHFEPVIALPDTVEVKTGEEDEEVIFKHRAKLFRFLKGEWKERGLGDVKILYQPNVNKARILMRREQILKIRCNHYVTPDLKLHPMPNSKGAALVWSAVDFADGEGTYEKFSIKFKNQGIAKQFEKAIDDAKGKLTGAKPKIQQPVVSPKVESLGALDDNGGDVEITQVEKATPEEIEKARKLMLPDHFYMYTRLPDCRGCLGCDDGAGQYCHQAEDQRGEVGNDYEDGDDDEDEDDDDDADDYEDEDEDEEESYEATDQPETKSGEGGFGSDGGSLFGGGSAGGFTFASLAKTSPQISFKQDPDKPFHWQGAGKQLFGSSAGGGHSDEEGEVQQGKVPLPDLVEVKTGEEDEIAVFSQRSKLFRFDKDANQWKEKGIGEMKILKHKSTGKYRLLLRREQVYKLACNHALTADMKFEPVKTSETSFTWHAQDYTESQPRLELFALKLKNVDLAKTFKNKIDEIQQELRLK